MIYDIEMDHDTSNHPALMLAACHLSRVTCSTVCLMVTGYHTFIPMTEPSSSSSITQIHHPESRIHHSESRYRITYQHPLSNFKKSLLTAVNTSTNTNGARKACRCSLQPIHSSTTQSPIVMFMCSCKIKHRASSVF